MWCDRQHLSVATKYQNPLYNLPKQPLSLFTFVNKNLPWLWECQWSLRNLHMELSMPQLLKTTKKSKFSEIQILLVILGYNFMLILTLLFH